MSNDIALLIMRMAIVAVFPISAYYKIMAWPGIVAPVVASGLPLPYALSVVGVAAEKVLPILVAAGIATRPAAMGLIAHTIAATYIGHPIWSVSAETYFPHLMSFLKTVGIVGALLLLVVMGPGRLIVSTTVRRTAA